MWRPARSGLRRGAVRGIAAALVLVLVSGCGTIRRGGAPEPSFDVDNDLRELAEAFAPANNIKAFYAKGASATKEDRDAFVTARLTLMNIRYIQFIRELTSDRQLLDTATDMLVLGLSIAGTAVGGAGTKTLLAALAAGVTGSKQIVDKNYFYEKTIPALVAQMNAERKAALIPIMTGVQQSLADYPLAQAVTDLHAYYHAGTLIGAINAIQADAGAKERDKDAIIATLSPVTIRDVQDKTKLTRSVTALTDAAKGRAVLEALGMPATEAAALDLDRVKLELRGRVRSARTSDQIAAVTKAFSDAGILLP
jgi:hypothetical protein